jgi:hypothetical protein
MFDFLLSEVPEVVGVSRLVARPAFSAPQFHTFAYTPEAVLVAAFVQGVGLWVEFPLLPDVLVPADVVHRVVPWLSLGVTPFERMTASHYTLAGPCPVEISSWSRVRTAAEEAVGCLAPVCDGVSYEHAAFDRGGSVRAPWHNPGAEYGFPAQAGLLTAYGRLLAAASLTPKLVRQAFGIEDRPEAAVGEEPQSVGDEPECRPGKKRPKPWQRRR